MNTKSSRWILVAVLVLATAACSQTKQVSTSNPESTASLSQSELEQLYRDRIDESRMKFVEADVKFMTGMIGHHAQALIMSRMAPTHGLNPQVQVLASRIINAQNDEIKSMQEWLGRRNQPVPEVHIDGLTLMLHGAGEHASHENMPGMLTPEQMKELDSARDLDFDRLFLTYMIQHHSGAITMVDELFSTPGAGQDEDAFKLASDINVDQITEIARMKKMLGALPEGSKKP